MKSITIHHWGSRGQKFDNVVSWLCDKRAGTSAHYVVEAGRVACIVDPDRRAWHAGSSRGNHESIGIECRPEATDADYATVAALVADLRAQYGNIPLKRHRDWTSTACPGVWDIARIDRLARGTKPPVKVSTGGAGVPTPARPASKPAQKPAVVKAPAFPLPRKAGALYYYGPSSGPKTSVSGMGRNSAVPGDVVQVAGRWQSKGLKAWQQRMKDRGWSGIGAVDGRFGPDTEKVVRQFQKSMGLPVDGKIGPGAWATAWTEPVK